MSDEPLVAIATPTYRITGDPRRAYFAENASRSAPYNAKIFGLVVGPFVLVFDRVLRAARKHRIRHRARHAVIGARRRRGTRCQSIRVPRPNRGRLRPGILCRSRGATEALLPVEAMN